MKIYIDLDGVLADFDSAAQAIIGTDNTYKYEFVFGPAKFWEKLNEDDMFFRHLAKMEDADDLFNSVYHFDPIILTALPKSNDTRVDMQKRAWVEEHFPGTEVITCLTKDKPKFCKPGDILIDDRAINREAWNAAGGTFIIHTTARRTIGTLEALGII